MIDETTKPNAHGFKRKSGQKYFDVLKSEIFKFPFSHVNVTTQGIIELHEPLGMSVQQIEEQLVKFDEHFPYTFIPYVKTIEKEGMKPHSYVVD